MAELQPLHPGLGLQLVVGSRPYTAPSAALSSTGRGRTVGGSRRTWALMERARPLTSHPGRRLPSVQVEPLIHSRLESIRSALTAADPAGTGLVSREKLKQVLKSVLSLNQNQLHAVLHEVCERSAAAVDYMQFLRRFGRAPAAHGACSSSVRRPAHNTSMSLSEIQQHVRDKIGANPRTVIRALRLFDYSREGHIRRHELRRILDNYCIRLTDKEFHRLWTHYSPNNKTVISYELFLDKLGFGDSLKIAPVCTKLEVSGQGTTQCKKAEETKQRPESQTSLCEAPSVLPHRKLQTLFYNKMCMNSTLVWQALQAFDTTRSGVVPQDVLRAVLSSFIFPMNPLSFQKLTSRYGVRTTTGTVSWKHFLGHFMSPVKEEDDANPHSDRAAQQPAPDVDNFHNIYPRLKELLHLPATGEAGCITRADLQYILERPGGTQPHILRPQITALLNVLDPENTGVVQLARLERLDPSITSAPTDSVAPSPPAVHTSAPLDTNNSAVCDCVRGEQTTADERQTTQWADKVSVASASWRTVESLLLDKLCERLGSVLAALKLRDPRHTGYVTREDLKEVLSCYGVLISDTHFKKLCASSSCSPPGSSTTMVSYRDFLRNLGVPLTDDANTPSSCCSHKNTQHTERSCTSPHITQQPSSSQQDGPDTYNILDIVFQRMRSRLDQRHTGLSDRIRLVIRRGDEALSEEDVRKILEDSWVILDDEHFGKFTELLGFRDGRMERSLFQAKYEEATARDQINPLLTSAEQCLADMKTRIKTVHGDNLTAFRLMDWKRKGVIDRHDFKALYNSLRFICREEEYQRLLDLIGLHPGGNLNYTEFVSVVESGRKQGTRTTSVQQQIHELLAHEAHHKWAHVSKVLCEPDSDGQGWIYKKSLRGLLFTYPLPMRSDEFEELWSRYDPEGRGCVAVCDFLERLGVHHDKEVRSQRKKQDQQDADRTVSSDAASLERIDQVIQENSEKLSDALTHLETRRDGTVTVEELLSLLNTYNCSIHREQLINHLHRLNVSMDDNSRRISYLDVLSALGHKTEKKSEPPPASPEAVHNIESLEHLSPSMALSRMRELVSISAPALYKAFSAFDPSSTGTIRALEFRRVLESFCARLSDKQFRYMLAKLELDGEKCTVNWKDFLNKFKAQSPLICECGQQRSKTRPFLETKPPEVTELLQLMQEVVSGHLYEITRELMASDPSNSATVSKEQFRELCDRHSLRLTDDQFECVWSQMPVTEQRKLQYREFLKQFGALGRALHRKPSSEPGGTKPGSSGGGALQRTKSAPQCSSRRPPSEGRLGTGSPPGSAARRLRGAVQRCWREIQRKCTELDPQQEGHVSSASFLEILQSLNIRVTQEQFQHLAGRRDFLNNDHVSYHGFLRHFLLNLKPAEGKTTSLRPKLPLPSTTTGAGVLSKDCVEVLLRIYESVRSSWAAIRRRFLTSDPTRTGSVGVQDFRKVLRHFSVSLTQEEFFHLSSYFDANTTGKICYNSFLWTFLR